MKVLLSLLGAAAITSSSVAFTGLNVLTNHQQTTEKQQIQSQDDSQIDWNMLKEETNKYFENIRTQDLSNFSQASNLSLEKNEEMFDYAQKQSLLFLEEFSDQNLNPNQILEAISKKFSDFKQNYNNQKEIEKYNSPWVEFSANENEIGTLSSNEEAQLKKTVDNLNIAKTTFTWASTASAIAAAGFWAAAWWWGISVPWAIACTTISAGTGLVAGILSECVTAYNKEASSWEKDKDHATLAWKFGLWIYKTVKPYLISAEATLSATSWAWPAVWAAVSAIAAIWVTISIYA